MNGRRRRGISIFDIEILKCWGIRIAREKKFMIGGEKKNKLLFMYMYVCMNK